MRGRVQLHTCIAMHNGRVHVEKNRAQNIEQQQRKKVVANE